MPSIIETNAKPDHVAEEVRRMPAPASLKDLWSSVRGYPLRAFFICLAGVSLENMDQAFFQFVLPDITREFGWSVADAGRFSALVFTIAGLCIAALGVLTDRIGRKMVFSASMIVGSLFVALMFFARSTPVLLALRTLGFATGGIQSPVVGTIVVEESPPRYRGLLSGILQIGYPLGWFLASQLSLVVLWWSGRDAWRGGAWRYVFFLSLLSIPYFILILKYLRETRVFLAEKARRHQALQHRATDAATDIASAARPGFTELFSPALRFRTAMLFFGEFFHVFAYGTTIMLNLYFQKARGWSTADAISLVGWSYGIGSIGYILSAIVGEYFIRRRNVIIIWAWLGSLAFAAMIWLTESWWTTAICYCLMTIFFYGTTAVKFTFIAENFPARLRATGVTFAGSLAVNLGVAFGPLALTQMTEWLGNNLRAWNLAYTFCGIAAIFLSGMFFLSLSADPDVIEKEQAAVSSQQSVVIE